MKKKKIFYIYAITALLMTGCGQNNIQNPEPSKAPESTAQNTETAPIVEPSQSNSESTNNTEMISSDQAKAIALEHAGLTKDQVTIIKCELDQDIDDMDYDVEFYTDDQLEYDYEIDAYTGRILGYDLDGHYSTSNTDGNDVTDTDSTDNNNNATSENAIITKEEAKKIALDQVPGAMEEHIRELHKDYDDGRLRYEVEIFFDQKEYEFDIDAQNGSILEWDKY